MQGISSPKARAFPHVTALLLVGLTLASSGCYFSTDARKQRAFDSGQKLLEENRVKEAQIQFQRAVNLDPNFAMAQYMLGNTSLKLRDFGKAYKALTTAVKLRPLYFESNRDLAAILIVAGKYTEARQYAQRALQIKPGDSRAQELLADTFVGTDDLQTAEEELQSLLQHDPGAFSAAMTLARVKIHTKDVEGAEAVLKAQTERKPTLRSLMELANFYNGTGKAEEAEKYYKQAANLDPKSADALYALGLFYMLHNRLADAEPVFQRLSSEHQENPRHRGALARFHYYGGQQQKGIAELTAIIQKYPDDRYNRNTLLQALVEANRTDEALKVLGDVLKKDPKDLAGRMVRGVVYLQTGKFDDALADFQEVLHQEPAYSPAHYYLGMVQLAGGRRGLAKQEFQDAIRYQPANMEPRLALVDLLLEENSTQPALEVLNETPGPQQNSYGIRLARARVATRKGDLLAAEQELVKLAQEYPKLPDTFSNLGALYGQRREWKKAADAFEQALNLRSNDRLATEGLAIVYMAMGQVPAGENRYSKLATADPKSSLAATGLARLRLAEGHDDEAEKGLRLFLAGDPKNVDALKLLADIRFRKGDRLAAEQLAKQIAQDNPNDPSAFTALAVLYAGEQRPQDAIREYREALKRDPDSVLATNNLAWMLSQGNGNFDEALALAQKNKERASSNPSVSDTLGWIYLKKGNYKLAITQFEDALRIQPKNQEFLYHLGVAQLRSNQAKDAEATLTSALSGSPVYPGREEARKLLDSLQGAKR